MERSPPRFTQDSPKNAESNSETSPLWNLNLWNMLILFQYGCHGQPCHGDSGIVCRSLGAQHGRSMAQHETWGVNITILAFRINQWWYILGWLSTIIPWWFIMIYIYIYMEYCCHVVSTSSEFSKKLKAEIELDHPVPVQNQYHPCQTAKGTRLGIGRSHPSW